MAVTNIGSIQGYVHRVGLEVAKPNLVHQRFGQKFTVPKGSGKTINWRRYERWAPTGAAALASTKILVEGTTPTAFTPTYTPYSATLSQYGNLVRYSDISEWINEVSVDTNLVARNAQNMTELMDRVVRDNIVSGTTVFRLTDSIGGVAGAARTNVVGRINEVALQKAIRTLDDADAKPFTEAITASEKYGTAPIRPAYIAILGPRVAYDLESSVQGFKSVVEYASADGTFPGEIGAWKNIRFVQSTQAMAFLDAGASVTGTGNQSTGGSLCDVYAMLIIGRDAFGVVDLEGSANTIYIPASQTDHANPLGLWADLGYKFMMVSKILDETHILRFECAASA